MVKNDNSVKYPVFSSFFFSFFIYLTLLLLLFFKITQYKEEAKKYTDSLDAFMDVVVIDSQIESNTPKASKPKDEKLVEEKPVETQKIDEVVKEQTTMKEPKPQKEIKEVKEVKKELPPPPKPKEEPNIQDLFKAVDTSKIKDTKTQKKEVTKKEEVSSPQKIQSRKKSDNDTTTTKKSASDLVKGLEMDQVAKSPKAQSTGIYDPFYGAITRILEQHWRVYRAQTDNTAEVEINIDKYGKFSYNIVGLSPDNEFNQKVKKFLADMQNVIFPPAPAGKDNVIKVVLEDKTVTE